MLERPNCTAAGSSPTAPRPECEPVAANGHAMIASAPQHVHVPPLASTRSKARSGSAVAHQLKESPMNKLMVAAGAAAFLAVSSFAALAAEVTGAVTAVDPATHSVTLDDGNTYVLP